jgi:hypothetical protein
MSDGPRRIGSIINQLMARRGYAQVESASVMEASVAKVVSPVLLKSMRVGAVKRGVLQIFANDSSAMQELTFLKRKILKTVQLDHPSAKITDVRFRVATNP